MFSFDCISESSKPSSSYAKIVLKDGDKDKINPIVATAVAVVPSTNVPSNNNNNKNNTNKRSTTDKPKMGTSAQDTSNNTKSTCNISANDPANNAKINDADDDDAFTPVASTRKDRNSRRNKDAARGTNAATTIGSNNNNSSNRSNKSQRQPRSENGRSKDKRAKGNNHRDDKEKSIAQPESVTTGEFLLLFSFYFYLYQ